MASAAFHVIFILFTSKILCEFCCLMQRLFFLNGEQDLSAFLLVDLGIVKYPTYNCIISDQIFPGLNDLLAYEEVLVCFYVEILCALYCLYHMWILLLTGH